MSENKVILYEKPSFQGLHLELTSSDPSLAWRQFANAASSLRVTGQPWVAYTDTFYTGIGQAYEEGSYNSLFYDNKIVSILLISGNLESPAIKLFEDVNFSGNSIVVRESAILYYGKLITGARSWQVLSGAWKMSDEINDNPRYVVTKAGDKVKSGQDTGVPYSIISLFPLKPGKPKFTINVQWDRKTELSSRVSQLDELIAVNKSKFAQKFTNTSSRNYVSTIEVEMNFSNETTIEVGTTFSIPLIGEMSTKLSNTFSVEKGKTESTSTTVTTKVSVPVSVPPKTKVTINVMRKDISYSIPVEIVIERNKVKETEYATLVCRDGTSVHVARKDEALS
ncbi:epidermal differentiation-specific protein-like [Discoglossus pictus]